MTKLSDLVEAGAKKYVFTKDAFATKNYETGEICACPLGMAAMAQGCPPDILLHSQDPLIAVEQYLQEYDIDIEKKVEHPYADLGRLPIELDTTIIELVDNYGWIPEQIVEWLRSIGE